MADDTLYPIQTGAPDVTSIDPDNHGDGKVEWPFYDRTRSRLEDD